MMSKYLVFLPVLVVALSSCLPKEPDYCTQIVIVNKTSKEVIISEYYSLGIEKEVFKIAPLKSFVSQIQCSEVPYLISRFPNTDSVKVTFEDSVVIHLNKSIISSNHNAVKYDDKRNLYKNGWVQKIEKKSKKASASSNTIETYTFE